MSLLFHFGCLLTIPCEALPYAWVLHGIIEATRAGAAAAAAAAHMLCLPDFSSFI